MTLNIALPVGAAARLNALTPADANRALTRCCGSQRWVEAMLAGRPYRDDEGLARAAGETWWKLERDDWLEAFAHHPRIGDRKIASPRHAATHDLSNREQAATASATADTLAALHAGNVAYEERFGHVFLIRAAGRSAADMLAALRRRLRNDATTELREAAAQQLEITLLRLAQLTEPDRGKLDGDSP